MSRIATFIASFFLLASVSLAQQASPPVAGSATFEGLGIMYEPPSPSRPPWSSAQQVSSDGSVVAGFSTSEQPGHEDEWLVEAIRWENGEMVGLGFLPGAFDGSQGFAISADGSTIVGSAGRPDSVVGDLLGLEAFRWQDGEMIGLGTLEDHMVSSLAKGVSGDGSVVVGTSFGFDSTSSTLFSHAFRWEGGEMENLGTLPRDFSSQAEGISPDGSVVVGASVNADGTQAVRWDNGVITPLGVLPGGDFYSIAFKVSADGSTVIGLSHSENLSLPPPFGEAFRWQDGVMEGLGDLPGGAFYSAATAIRADGSMIGGWGETEEGFRAMIWTEEDGMRNLMEILEQEYDLDLGGWILDTVRGISDDGSVIVGDGYNPDGNPEGWRVSGLQPVADEATPEALADVLSAPSPNPASGTSTFTIAVEHGQHVVVEVFDVMGRRVQTVYEGALAAGMSETLTLNASALPASVYMIRAKGEDFTKTQQVTVVR